PLKYVDPSGHIFGIDDLIIAIVIGAALGAATSAATGGDIGKGALTGASGGIFGGLGGALGGALGGQVGGLAGAVAGGATGGAAGAHGLYTAIRAPWTGIKSAIRSQADSDMAAAEMDGLDVQINDWKYGHASNSSAAQRVLGILAAPLIAAYGIGYEAFHFFF